MSLDGDYSSTILQIFRFIVFLIVISGEYSSMQPVYLGYPLQGQEPCSSTSIDYSPLWEELWFKSPLPQLSNYQKIKSCPLQDLKIKLFDLSKTLRRNHANAGMLIKNQFYLLKLAMHPTDKKDNIIRPNRSFYFLYLNHFQMQ